jgi:hypothetical protein
MDKDKIEWLKSRIYAPVERVRARRCGSEWEVFDGVEVHTFTDEQFKQSYVLSAQTLYENKAHGQYEYHVNKPVGKTPLKEVPDYIKRELERSEAKAGRP